MNKKCRILVHGCDDSTIIEKELTEEELELIQSVAKEVTESSEYDCMPTMAIEVEEEPLYCALVKSHELMVDDGTLTFKYWNFDTFNGDLFPSNQFSRGGRFLTEMSKSEWNKIGINSSNADFVKVNE